MCGWEKGRLVAERGLGLNDDQWNKAKTGPSKGSDGWTGMKE